MTAPELAYPGKELDVFADAVNWRGYWSSLIRPLIGEAVLEVGAGIGSATRALYVPGVNRWLALEPDVGLASQITRTTAAAAMDRLEVRHGTLESVRADETFDTILYVDVLEHIADDAAEAERAFGLLRKNGHLIVLSPAHQYLYSAFDAAIGHYRRYSAASLRKLRPAGAVEVSLRYLDSVGLLASAANRLLLRSAHPSRGQVRFWDRGMVPVSRVLDPLLGYSAGKSLLAVWRRPQDAGGR